LQSLRRAREADDCNLTEVRLLAQLRGVVRVEPMDVESCVKLLR
jgi:hypothetical protein